MIHYVQLWPNVFSIEYLNIFNVYMSVYLLWNKLYYYLRFLSMYNFFKKKTLGQNCHAKREVLSISKPKVSNFFRKKG